MIHTRMLSDRYIADSRFSRQTSSPQWLRTRTAGLEYSLKDGSWAPASLSWRDP
jgi:hypothetical protein